MQVHFVNAHLTYPGWTEGALNEALIARAREHLSDCGHRATVTKIEDGYDPDSEVQRHLEADLVVLQTPLNWFGAPWIHKRYVDEVFNAGLHSQKFMVNDGRTRSDPARQYGTGGRMQGRGFFVSTTSNAPASVFDDPDGVLFAGKSVDDLLLHLTATYRFVGYTVLQHHGVFDVFHNTTAIPHTLEHFGTHVVRQLDILRVGRTEDQDC